MCRTYRLLVASLASDTHSDLISRLFSNTKVFIEHQKKRAKQNSDLKVHFKNVFTSNYDQTDLKKQLRFQCG